MAVIDTFNKTELKKGHSIGSNLMSHLSYKWCRTTPCHMDLCQCL